MAILYCSHCGTRVSKINVIAHMRRAHPKLIGPVLSVHVDDGVARIMSLAKPPEERFAPPKPQINAPEYMPFTLLN